jgi:geranylgeranyl pyrophosphate synthase
MSSLQTDPQQKLPSSVSTLPKIGPTQAAVYEAFDAVKGGLKLVEDRAQSRFVSEAEALNKIPTYLLKQGGKRIRPILALLSARLFGMTEPSEELINVAAGIELIHMATLLHDDIIDQSPTRRHQRSAYLEFGMMPTLLSGDFLLVRAFGLCAQLDSYVIDQTERACVELTEGEILEGTLDAESEVSFEHYVNVVSKKTAALFDLAAKVGAHLSQTNPETTKSLGLFGRYAGIAFQMVDDILDVTADESLLGKPAGTDLKQKTPSLVNILWLQSGDSEAKSFFAQTEISPEKSKETAKYLKDSPIIEDCRILAKDYADKASSQLEGLDQASIDTKTKDQLLSIVNYTLQRCL